MGKQDNQSPPMRRSDALGQAIKWLVIIFVLILLALLIGLFLTNNYLQSNKTKILEDLPFLNKATVAFEKTDISLYKNFPSASIIIHQLTVKDSLFPQHQKHLLEIETLSANFSLGELLKKKITIHSIHLEKGTFRLHTDKNGYNNLKSILPNKRSESSNRKELDLALDGLNIKLAGLDIHITDDTKGTSIHGQVDQLNTTLNISEHQVKANLDFALQVQELSFKKENGSFIENSQLRGSTNLKWRDDLLDIDPFDLTINDEVFEFSGSIPTNGQVAELYLENQQTRFDRVIPLLPKKIQEELAPYQIEHPFPTRTLIKTDFKPNSMPLIKVDFNMEKNDLVIFDIPLKQTSLSGKFINSLYEDTQELTTERGNIRLMINDLVTAYDSFNARSKDVVITATKEAGAKIISQLSISGPVSGISDWLENDQFFFEQGTFKLAANLNGSLRNVNELIIQSNAQMLLSQFSVFYQPANSAFSFEKMELIKKVGDAFFTIVNNAVADGPKINVDGNLANLPALLLDAYLKQVSSEVHIVSSKLTWQNFLNLFGENGYLKRQIPKTDAEKKRSMKETLRGVYENFHPRLTVEIDTLEYLDKFQLKNFKSGLHFEDANGIVLEDTEFDYEVGHVLFSGSLDISDPLKTPFDFTLEASKINLSKLLPVVNYFNIPMLKAMDHPAEDVSVQIQHMGIIDDENGLMPNTSTGRIAIQNKENNLGSVNIGYRPKDQNTTTTTIELKGNPVVFNDFFNTDKFIFREGFFEVIIEHDGPLNDIQEVLEEGAINFSLLKGEVFYQPIGITFPLASIDLTVLENNAVFTFVLQSDLLEKDLQFSGNLENLSELVIGNTNKPLSTRVDIYASKVNWKEFQSLFIGRDMPIEKPTIEPMKATISDLLNTFHPRIQIDVDTFVYKKNLIVVGATSGIYLQDSSTVYLEKTGFHFHDGSMLLNGAIDLSPLPHTPFDINLHTKDFDVAGLLKSLDYLSLPTLKETEKLRGTITMNLDLKGAITENGKGLVEEATKGILNFDLQNLEIKGFEPLNTIGAKIKMKDRFEDIRFAPITNQVQIYGNKIGFSQMEIQSNMLHLFVEGIFSFGMDTNLWISVPLHNLKKKDVEIIPEKKGYAAYRRKIYLEATSDETGAVRFKFYPTKRKFYKDRGFLHKYRSDRKRDRAIRKEMRKQRE